MALGPIKKSDEVEAKLLELASMLIEEGRSSGEAVLERQKQAGKVVRNCRPRVSSEEFLQEARRALEDEIHIARPAEFEEDIDPNERDRELAKKALAHLRLSQLKDIATTMALDHRGTEEQVVDRLARALGSDPVEIARLRPSQRGGSPREGGCGSAFSDSR